jgi:hypothetical protein
MLENPDDWGLERKVLPAEGSGKREKIRTSRAGLKDEGRRSSLESTSVPRRPRR